MQPLNVRLPAELLNSPYLQQTQKRKKKAQDKIINRYGVYLSIKHIFIALDKGHCYRYQQH